MASCPWGWNTSLFWAFLRTPQLHMAQRGSGAVPDGFALHQYSLYKPSFWQLMRNMPCPGRGAFINRVALATWNQGIRWTLPGCQRGCACRQHHLGFDIHKDFTYFSKNNSFKRPIVNIEEEEAKGAWKVGICMVPVAELRTKSKLSGSYSAFFIL